MELNTARSMALAEMSKWGLLPVWHFEFNNRKRGLGLCKHLDKAICLSTNYVALNSEEAILDTILHEIAHALVGPGKGHKREWKLMCMRVGCQSLSATKSANMPTARYTLTCPCCGQVFRYHRQSKTIKRFDTLQPLKRRRFFQFQVIS